jgi:hypothetical protein
MRTLSPMIPYSTVVKETDTDHEGKTSRLPYRDGSRKKYFSVLYPAATSRFPPVSAAPVNAGNWFFYVALFPEVTDSSLTPLQYAVIIDDDVSPRG